MKSFFYTTASAAALLVGTPALAQSAPSNPQVPSYPAEPAACASVTGNCSQVDQAGTNGSATVLQTGTGNVSNIQQTASSQDVLADVKQTGTNASSFIGQSGGPGVQVGQQFVRNRALVEQTGDGAKSVILQGASSRLGVAVSQDGDSRSFVEQFGRTSEAEVRQRGGAGNDSVIFQIANNSALGSLSNASIGIDQNGNQNSAFFYQGDISDGNEEGNFRGSVKQTGDGNSSTTMQLSDVAPHPMAGQLTHASTIQNGDGNASDIIQDGITDADVKVAQYGNDNVSNASQRNNFATGSGFGSVIEVRQSGDQNDSLVDQDAGRASAIVSQTSAGINSTSPRARDNRFDGGTDLVRGNFSRVEQSGGGTMNAFQTQSGQLNRADLRQSNASGTANATVTQTGIFNNSDLRQSAAASAAVSQGGAYGDNDSLVEQTADGASASVVQAGNSTASTYFPSNQSLIRQDAMANADVMQSGQQNFSAATQHVGSAGASLTVRQTNPANPATMADTNASTIDQYAANSAYVEQVGTGNASWLAQSGTGPATFDRNTLASAEVRQLGTDGISNVNQSGNGNEANVEQRAGSNGASSMLVQSGADNLALVSQGGTDNSSSILQSGNANTAAVTQTSDYNISTITQSGTGSTATVTQGM